jgi:hypothetical protein
MAARDLPVMQTLLASPDPALVYLARTQVLGEDENSE